jgi:hydroxyacid-oxoacid transhydrogenase
VDRRETVFTMEATPVKYGPGAAAEAGWELRRLGVTRALIVTDPGIMAAGIVERVRGAIEGAGVACEVFDGVAVEPTLEAVEAAAAFASDGRFDGFVGLGGGSSLDTAKAADLLATHPAPVLDYIYPPVGGGRTPPGPLKPLLAVPTTSGTGSEATTVSALELPEQRAKAAISNPYLRPSQAIVDPLLSLSMPRQVTAACGLDVVCHAVESFTARSFDTRPAPEDPSKRPSYQGANPVSDLWAAKALADGGAYLRQAVADGDDVDARGRMMLAASIAGIGFGSAGTHIPHACAYPIAGLKHTYASPGYPGDRPMVPHGFAVIVTAPAAFRATFASDPEKHRRAAELIAGEPVPEADEETLPRLLTDLMRDVGAPRGLRELGYDDGDVDDLVTGALKQQRMLSIAPAEVGPDQLAEIFSSSMENWTG